MHEHPPAMGLLLTALALWITVSLGLAALWTAVVYAARRNVRTSGLPPVFVPQPRPEYVDVSTSAAERPATAHAEPVAVSH